MFFLTGVDRTADHASEAESTNDTKVGTAAAQATVSSTAIKR